MAQQQGRAWALNGLAARAGLGKLPHPVLIALCSLVVLCLGVATMVLVAGIGSREGESFEVNSSDSATSQPTVASETSRVVVDVAGQVLVPGVYELDEGSRVSDAVQLAGGLTPDAQSSAVNLARKLVDGEQIIIPSVQEAQTATTSGYSAGITSSLVNINVADVNELQELDGIGEATAQKIVEDRKTNGPFLTIEDIMRVSGIGEGKFAGMKDDICV